MKKRIIVIICVIVVLGMVLDILGVQVYKSKYFAPLNEITNGTDGIIEGNYMFTTFEPEGLFSYGGNISVTELIHVDGETGKRINSVTCDLLIFPSVFGNMSVIATINDNGTGDLPDGLTCINFKLSEKMELLEGEENIFNDYKTQIEAAYNATRKTLNILN